ncbi:MAG TPA: SH3 domain-containing protein [Longimicrobiales bacterium]|nr:SH3 domain-containing protein [Longimicrobiales bacterium]
MRMRLVVSAFAALAASLAASPATAQVVIPDHGVIGVGPEQLRPEYWVQRQPAPDREILTPTEIAEQNRRMLAVDPSLHDLDRLPAALTRAQVREWVERRSQVPTRQLFDERGDSVTAAAIAALVDGVQLDAIPPEQPLRFALVTRRADLRTFPTRLRVFSSRDNTDIDRWQESALFPGTPAVIVHESRDAGWWFVVSHHYAAWIEKSHVAEGPREAVLGYARKEPYLVVTGAKVHTVFTPERPQVSELQLEMGVRVPLLAGWPADSVVNGQHPYAGHVVELPVRTEDGRLELVPALLPPTADVASGYLPLTAGGILRQAFKFLGERYGWGHGYNGRDCSGFVSEVYRSFGVDLPRNTGDQANTPALNRLAFTEADTHGRRLAVVGETQVGDLLYIPGHVMMVIGRVDGVTYVIHDTTGTNYLVDGALVRVPLNGVSVTQLETLQASAERTTVETIRSIQRIRR